MAVSHQTTEGFQLIEEAMHRLHRYLRACNYSGYDPYDGLESRVFQATPLKRFRLARLAWIQMMKRSPINLRPLLLVPQGRNPKGIALCASALLTLSQIYDDSRHVDEARALLKWLVSHQALGRRSYAFSWGYNFDWQSRAFFVSKGTPNAICTIFVANAFLDAFEQLGDREYLNVAQGSCRFILEHLAAHREDELYICYVPRSDAQVHNVNLLGAALLARVYKHSGGLHLREAARKAVVFSVRRQNADGSWYYGEASNQRWIDNFHTGFNLMALAQYRRYTNDDAFLEAEQQGYRFWDRHFFLPDGVPKYYHNAIYPIDVHCAAQEIVTYLEYAKEDPQVMEKACRVASWTFRHLHSPEGFFYYQKHRWYTIGIPYVRWAQAWMFCTLSTLLVKLARENGRSRFSDVSSQGAG